MNLLQFLSVASFKIKSDEEYRKAESLEVIDPPFNGLHFQWLYCCFTFQLNYILLGNY